jgi:hypothetical protein
VGRLWWAIRIFRDQKNVRRREPRHRRRRSHHYRMTLLQQPVMSRSPRRERHAFSDTRSPFDVRRLRRGAAVLVMQEDKKRRAVSRSGYGLRLR